MRTRVLKSESSKTGNFGRYLASPPWANFYTYQRKSCASDVRASASSSAIWKTHNCCHPSTHGPKSGQQGLPTRCHSERGWTKAETQPLCTHKSMTPSVRSCSTNPQHGESVS